MRVVLLGALLALPAAMAQTQPASGPATVETRADGVITVRVKDSQGRPLPGAWVTLRGHTRDETPQEISRHSAANAGGQVRFDKLPNGSYGLGAPMAGRSLAQGMQGHVLLDGAEAGGEVELILRRRPVLTGRVVDQRGTPMYNAKVKSLRLVANDGVESIVIGRELTTDDRGVYRTTLEEPGAYWLMASHMETPFPRGSAPQPTGIAFYPNSPDLLTANAVEMAFDQPEASFDITLPAAPNTNLNAYVFSGPLGSPCTTCRYSLRLVAGPHSFELIGGGSGEQAKFGYRGIPAGLYRIYVQDNEGHAGWWASSEVTVPEGRRVEVAISTGPPVMVAGKVTLENPPVEALREYRDRKDAITVRLDEVGSHFFAVQGSNRRAELALDQSEIDLGLLPPEKFRLVVRVEGGGGYLAAVSRGGRDLASPILDFAEPGGWADLEIRIRFDLAEPEIHVRADGFISKERATHRLVLVPDAEENPFGQYYDTNCPAGERCFGAMLPPGRYWAIVLPEASRGNLDLRDPKLRARFEAWGTDLELSPGKNPPVELVPMTAEVLRGL